MTWTDWDDKVNAQYVAQHQLNFPTINHIGTRNNCLTMSSYIVVKKAQSNQFNDSIVD